MFRYSTGQLKAEDYWWGCYDHLNRYCNLYGHGNVSLGVIVRVLDKEFDLGVWLDLQRKRPPGLFKKGQVAFQQMVENGLLTYYDYQPTLSKTPEVIDLTSENVVTTRVNNEMEVVLVCGGEQPTLGSNKGIEKHKIFPVPIVLSHQFVAFAYFAHPKSYEEVEIGYAHVHFNAKRENDDLTIEFLLRSCVEINSCLDELDGPFQIVHRYSEQDKSVTIQKKAALAVLEFRMTALAEDGQTVGFLSVDSKARLRENRAYQAIKRIQEAATDRDDTTDSCTASSCTTVSL